MDRNNSNRPSQGNRPMNLIDTIIQKYITSSCHEHNLYLSLIYNTILLIYKFCLFSVRKCPVQRKPTLRSLRAKPLLSEPFSSWVKCQLFLLQTLANPWQPRISAKPLPRGSSRILRTEIGHQYGNFEQEQWSPVNILPNIYSNIHLHFFKLAHLHLCGSI